MKLDHEKWVRVPGVVLRVLEKSIVYRTQINSYAKEIFIPRSQLEIIPQNNDSDILVRGWLVAKNGWPQEPVKVV